MNKAVYVIPIVALLIISGALAYGYMSSQSQLSTKNSENSILSAELNKTLSNYTVLQNNYLSQQNSIKSYESNIQTLKSELQKNQTQVILNDAFTHWDYLSIENISLVMSQYSSNATLKWVGGPLSGTYNGINNISSTWNKFFSLWSAVWFYTPITPIVSITGNSSSVVSTVQFVLTSYKTPLEVDYLNISYTIGFYYTNGNWLINNEIWDIQSHGIISYSYQEYSDLVLNQIMNDSFSHWDYIAIENTSLLLPQYYNNASLVWIGGPLSGTYNGINNISSTWNKFFSLWSAVWFYTISPPTLSIINNNYYVNAQVQWVLTSADTPLQVNSILTNYTIEYSYINGMPMITKEIWHITNVGFISYTAKEYENLQTQALLNASFSHWNNIAIENISLVMSQYYQNSTLHWIGGKLAGNYTNYSEIQSTWSKFFNAWSAVWFYSEAPPMVNFNVSGGKITSGTVTADIQFVVQSSLNSSAFDYIDVVYTINFSISNNNFYITNEIFDNVGTGPLSQVGPFA
jgi:hypothetical protein